jgi:CRP-like cAMP-binding protein
MIRSHRRSGASDVAAVGILEDCPTPELQLIGQRSRTVDVPDGRLLCEQGSLALDCMLIESGYADVFVGGQHVATVGPGETVGEMGILERRPRSATVVARTGMRVRLISAGDLDSLTQRTPVFTRALLRELSARVRGANRAATQP